METPTPTISKQGIANQRYRNKHRAKYNDYMKAYMKKRREDPVIREKLRVDQLKYYAKKRAKKLAEKLADNEEILLQPK
tara:strand:- start:743 stop:979 length:237 start_codon:yes stop_codon:yes gene_type:complete